MGVSILHPSYDKSITATSKVEPSFSKTNPGSSTDRRGCRDVRAETSSSNWLGDTAFIDRHYKVRVNGDIIILVNSYSGLTCTMIFQHGS